MYIDKFEVEVLDKEWDSTKRDYKKQKSVVAEIKDTSGIGAKDFGKFLDDLGDNYTYRGTVTIKVIIDKVDD
tara:strand:- start:1998 stop:2213 length:216 start_codon:yes stop_codon:yes gene_type:complete